MAALGLFTRPFEISIMNRGIVQGVDISVAQIIDSNGHALLQNSEFSSSWDNWFPVCGDHTRWHIKNLFICWFFKGGLLGLFVMVGLCTYVGAKLLQTSVRGDRFATISSAALAGVVMVGLFDSVFDEPRIAFLAMTALQVTGIPHAAK